MEGLRPVLLPNEIVPFFISVDHDQQRLHEVVQVRLSDVASKEERKKISSSIVSELSIGQGFNDPIYKLMKLQYKDYLGLTEKCPCTEWAQAGSAVHILNIEVGIDAVVYADVIEWDIFDTTADPDEFAQLTVKELGLPVEFSNVISAQIRYQIIRYRSMHCHPDTFRDFITRNPAAAPQTTRGLRPMADLLDFSPIVGLVPGVTAKKTISSRERHQRHMKRTGANITSGALQPAEDVGDVPVGLVPIVRAAPMPEDTTLIDLAAVPWMMQDDRFENEEVERKVRKKFESPIMMSQRPDNDSDSDSGADM